MNRGYLEATATLATRTRGQEASNRGTMGLAEDTDKIARG